MLGARVRVLKDLTTMETVLLNGHASRTAVAAARYRAEHQEVDGGFLFQDPLARFKTRWHASLLVIPSHARNSYPRTRGDGCGCSSRVGPGSPKTRWPTQSRPGSRRRSSLERVWTPSPTAIPTRACRCSRWITPTPNRGNDAGSRPPASTSRHRTPRAGGLRTPQSQRSAAQLPYRYLGRRPPTSTTGPHLVRARVLGG